MGTRRCLVKLQGATSEMHRYLPKDIQVKGRAGSKNGKANCTWKQWVEMIDLSEVL